MAVTWGAYANRLSMGINLTLSGSVTQASPDITVNADTYCRTDYTTYNNDISWDRSTSAGGTDSGSARLNQDENLKLESFTSTRTASYSGTTSYSVTVKGSGPGAGPASYTRSITIPRRPTAAPTAPGTPACSSVTSTGFVVTWAAPSDMKGMSVDYYRVEVSTNSGFTNIVKNPTTSSRSATITGLTPGTTYYIRVRLAATGWDDDRTSPNSSTRTQATAAQAPSTPGAPSIASITASSATVNMAYPNDNGATITDTGFWLYTVASGGTAIKTDGVPSTVTSFNFTGLSPYTTYYAEVAAQNSVGWSARSARRAFTTLAIAPTLTSCNASSISRNSAVIGQAVIGNNGGQAPTNFRVEYNTAPNSTGSIVNTKGSYASITLTGLSPLTTYYYRAAAANSAGFGAYTAWKSFTTLDVVPSEPAAPAVSAIGDHDATVTWTAPALNGATLNGYTVVLSAVDDPDQPAFTQLVGPDALSVAFSGLPGGTTFKAYVMARATPNDSGFSTGTEFSTTGSVGTLELWLNDVGTWAKYELWRNDGGVWGRQQLYYNDAGTWRYTA